ncbi:copper-binding protein [Rickettsiales bacterium]|nr:copper-binding protein [Rickettsiales bacterium]
MKKIFLAISLGMIIQVSSVLASNTSHNHNTSHHGIEKSQLHHQGIGIVNSISRMNHAVNITHDPIPSLNWPKMTMDLDVSKDIDLKSIELGKKIKFHIALGKDKKYRIIKIENHHQTDNHMNHKEKHHHD